MSLTNKKGVLGEYFAISCTQWFLIFIKEEGKTTEKQIRKMSVWG